MQKLEVVASAVYDSADMLGMLVFLLALALILFSTLIYFSEKGAAIAGDIDVIDAYKVKGRRGLMNVDTSGC